jgi:hypothetical protein
MHQCRFAVDPEKFGRFALQLGRTLTCTTNAERLEQNVNSNGLQKDKKKENCPGIGIGINSQIIVPQHK